MKKTIMLLILSFLLGQFIGAPAFAQKAPPARQYKNSTTIPPGIELPDKVKTRLCTLKSFDGFPDKATVEKLYDNLDFQRAVQAYLLGLAPVNQLANRKGVLEVGPGAVEGESVVVVPVRPVRPAALTSPHARKAVASVGAVAAWVGGLLCEGQLSLLMPA